jgi:hypothetical protein
MIQQYRLGEEEEIKKFVQLAAIAFGENPQYATFTDGEIEPGKMFAVRWGLGEDCILIFKIDEDFQPRNYANVIKKGESK